MLEPDLRPPMHSIEEQFEIRSIETAMENGASRYINFIQYILAVLVWNSGQLP